MPPLSESSSAKADAVIRDVIFWISFAIILMKTGLDIYALCIDAKELKEHITSCDSLIRGLLPWTSKDEEKRVKDEWKQVKENKMPWSFFLSAVKLRKAKRLRAKLEELHTKGVVVKALEDIAGHENVSALDKVALIHFSWKHKHYESAGFTLACLYLHGLAGLEENHVMCAELLYALTGSQNWYWSTFASAMRHFLDLDNTISNFSQAEALFRELLEKESDTKAHAHAPLARLSQFYLGLIYRLRPVVDSVNKANEYMNKAASNGENSDNVRRDFFSIID